MLRKMINISNRLVVGTLILVLLGWEVISRLQVFATPGLDTMRTYGDYMTLIGSENDPSYGTAVEAEGKKMAFFLLV